MWCALSPSAGGFLFLESISKKFIFAGFSRIVSPFCDLKADF